MWSPQKALMSLCLDEDSCRESMLLLFQINLALFACFVAFVLRCLLIHLLLACFGCLVRRTKGRRDVISSQTDSAPLSNKDRLQVSSE